MPASSTSSNVFDVRPSERPKPGQELVLARYELHRNYCGLLMYFAQFTDAYAADPQAVETPGYQWQIRCNGQPRDPYLTFGHIINPWGLSGFPVYLRLEEGCTLEFAIRNVGSNQGSRWRRSADGSSAAPGTTRSTAVRRIHYEFPRRAKRSYAIPWC